MASNKKLREKHWLSGQQGKVALGPEAEKMETAVRSLLESLGEDPNREGLLQTPQRVAQALLFLTKGYEEDPDEVINKAVFHEKHDEMIVVKDISLYSLCEHHMLPFVGRVHVAYIPDQRIIGLSKIARLVDIYARRLQVQERLTQQIAKTLQDALKPKGTAVVVEAEHMCMQMRGVQKRGSVMITSAMLGVFRAEATRSEFLAMIKNGR
ncbi:MAG TPA: GTP cyclohydrolase I FolE [Deltaproteobacteria bacterium]|nr:MAG: GTP cyclohydrolase I FolE [Deltaproteobacteria bacterium GWA2_45_12]HBF12357.1 GTP cyclohydrolase I FolE [Deltaproteobacteria bacterium]